MSVNIVTETSLSTVQIGEIRALVDRSNKKDNTNYVFDGSDDFKKDICLEVQTDNENALGLYIDVGFKLVTEFKYYRKSL